MKTLLNIRASRLLTLMIMSIALLLLISGRTIAQAGKTMEIDITNKQYGPPTRTPNIPPGFKEQGVRFAVRAGETIKICNKDQFFAKPYSLSAGNKFEGLSGPGGLRPGSC